MASTHVEGYDQIKLWEGEKESVIRLGRKSSELYKDQVLGLNPGQLEKKKILEGLVDFVDRISGEPLGKPELERILDIKLKYVDLLPSLTRRIKGKRTIGRLLLYSENELLTFRGYGEGKHKDTLKAIAHHGIPLREDMYNTEEWFNNEESRGCFERIKRYEPFKEVIEKHWDDPKKEAFILTLNNLIKKDKK